MRIDSLPMFLDALQGNIDPNYEKAKKELHDLGEFGSQFSLAILASTVAIKLIQSTLNSSSHTSLLDISSLSICYLTYNSYQICENLKTFSRNPKKFMTFGGLGNSLNEDKFRKCLTKGTFCFNWAADALISKLEIK